MNDPEDVTEAAPVFVNKPVSEESTDKPTEVTLPDPADCSTRE